MKKSIAVIAGGYSQEAQVSVKSAATVMNNLDLNTYAPMLVMIDRTGWYVEHEGKRIEIDKNDFSAPLPSGTVQFDAAFIAIHGTPGEDGKLQAYFDMIGMPYSTAGHLAMTLSFNKYACNSFLKEHGITCANSILLVQGDSIDELTIEEECGLPCFVKPNDGGSSFGVSKVKTREEIIPAIENAWLHGEQVIVESFISGTEVTCGIVKVAGKVRLFPITEIVSDNEFFDFEAKYNGASQEITPARISDDEAQAVHDITERVFNLLHLEGIARIDFIIQDGEPFVIEANTVPGLSAASLIPQQAERVGLPLSDLFGGVLSDILPKK